MDRKKLNILLIEEDPGDALLLKQCLSELRDFAFTLFRARELSEGFALMERERIDLTLVCLNLPDSLGIATVRSVVTRAGQMPVIAFIDVEDELIAAEVKRAGAKFCMIKARLSLDILEQAIVEAVRSN